MTTQNTLPESIKKKIEDEAKKKAQEQHDRLLGQRFNHSTCGINSVGFEAGYTAAAEAILSKPGEWNLVDKQGVKVLFEHYCHYRNNEGQLEFNDWLDASPIDGLVSESATPSSRVQQLEQAAEILEELCHLKDYKDSEGKDAYYTEEQPKLWVKAKEFLKQHNQLK